MRVFVTGATGFVGSRVVGQLIEAGHEVIGLTRSDAGEAALRAAGATAYRGDIEDLASLRAGTALADAVIHTAFDHDFNNFVSNCEKDRQVILALGGALGTRGPLIITSGVGMGDDGSGRPAREDIFNSNQPNPRKASEEAAEVLLASGHDVRVVRLPQVHNTEREGLIRGYIQWAKEAGEAVYVGDAANRWSAAHVDDVARVYGLALDRGVAGGRYNAVGEEGVVAREVVDLIARKLGVPARSVPAEEAPATFGWLAMFVGADLRASNTLTRERLNWTPTGPGLIADLEAKDWSKV